MGLLRFPEALEGGVFPFFIIHATLSIAMVMNILISLLQKLGVKLNLEPPELAEPLWSYAYAEEAASDLGFGLGQLAMTSEEIGNRVPITLFEASSSSFSFSPSYGDGVGECAVCLRKFHGGEEMRSLLCGHVFHKSCVDKWILDYEKMTCPLCRVCLVNAPAQDDGSYKPEQYLGEEQVMQFSSLNGSG